MWERSINGLPLAYAQTGDEPHNPGMCTNWELTWWPFTLWDNTLSTEPHQSGHQKSRCQGVLKHLPEGICFNHLFNFSKFVSQRVTILRQRLQLAWYGLCWEMPIDGSPIPHSARVPQKEIRMKSAGSGAQLPSLPVWLCPLAGWPRTSYLTSLYFCSFICSMEITAALLHRSLGGAWDNVSCAC